MRMTKKKKLFLTLFRPSLGRFILESPSILFQCSLPAVVKSSAHLMTRTSYILDDNNSSSSCFYILYLPHSCYRSRYLLKLGGGMLCPHRDRQSQRFIAFNVKDQRFLGCDPLLRILKGDLSITFTVPLARQPKGKTFLIYLSFF